MSEIEFVSLIRVIQVPEHYHGKLIRVVGIGAVEFEHKALYISTEDLKKAITKNGVWMDLAVSEETKKLNGKCILVEGVFDKDNMGHLKLFSGSIKEIRRAEIWSEE